MKYHTFLTLDENNIPNINQINFFISEIDYIINHYRLKANKKIKF